MPTATQLNLSLDSEIGTLARLCRDLAHGGVNLLALSAPEVGRDKGLVRLLVPNRELAAQALTKAGYTFAVVLFVELKNRPGALAKAVEKLARARISIRYAYATASSRTRTTAAVVAVAEGDLASALKLLG
jgi:hypothetical protein